MRNVLLKRVVTMFIIISIVMPASMPMSIWAASDPTQETTITIGEGTSRNPYQIWNVSQLEEIATKGLDQEYKQMADIVMETSEEWTPIGTKTNPFTGVFDGNGYVIKNLTAITSATHLGLFAYIKDATLKNVTLEDVNLKGMSHVGSIAGYANGTCIISNCSSSGNVFATNTGYYVGGLVGYADFQEGVIESSHYSGKVSGYQGVGGLVGYLHNGEVHDSYNLSDVVSTNRYTGGIAGFSVGTKYNKNFNMGTLSGVHFTGGIVGYGTSTSIENSYNQGEIKAAAAYAGGIAGYSYNTDSIIQNCYSSGKITASSFAGGIAGASKNGLGINGCASVAQSISALSSSGSAGRISAGKSEIYRNNVANKDQSVTVNGITKTISSDDTALDGLNIANSTLTADNSYWIDTLGWDFSSEWMMAQEDGNFPTLQSTYKTVTQITLSESSKSVSVGDKFVLTATILPENATNKNITWSSSDTEIASVSENGEVTALANGEVTITAKSDCSGLEAECSVTVTTAVTGIHLSSTSETLKSGYLVILTATVVPDTASNKTLQWTSSDPSVASVTPDGIVRAMSDGEAVITVKSVSGEIEATCDITVSTPITDIWISSKSEELLEGESIKLTANVLPETTQNKNVIWKSSDPSVATVSDDGTVKALKKGTATITAQTEDGKFEAQCEITVLALKENIALGRKAVSNSVSGSYAPSNAVDGNAKTRWTAVSKSTNVFFTIDFEEEVTFDEINIIEHADRINDFKLQYFDGNSWVDFHTGTTIGSNFNIRFEPVTCTQMRLFVVSTKGTYGASIFEMEVIKNLMVGSIEESDTPH